LADNCTCSDRVFIVAVIIGEGMIRKMVRAQCGYYAISRRFRHRYVSKSIAGPLAKRIVAVAFVVRSNCIA